MDRRYFLYILASRSRTLYIGVTGHLLERVQQHRDGTIPGFTNRYRIYRLVYFETYLDVRAAIRCEKEIKTWTRNKKLSLISKRNPTWEDLADELFAKYPRKADPSRRSG
jgi:putative endonuclease